MKYSALQLALMVDEHAVELSVADSNLSTSSVWYSTFGADRSKWLSRTLDNWKEFSNVLPKFYSLLRQFLYDVALVKLNEKECVVYSFTIESESYLYVGEFPKSDYESDLNFMPNSLKHFYLELHDGFYFQPSIALGPLPFSSIFCIGDEEWGWIDDDETSLDLNKLFAIFSNGGGGYICLSDDFKKFDNELKVSGIAWWDDGPPDVESFWSLLDAWMYLGLIE